MLQETHTDSFLVRETAGHYRQAEADEIVQVALRIVSSQLRQSDSLSSPQLVKDFLRMKMGSLEHEVFALLHLDAQHRVIEFVEMFRGSITQTSVYPREVVKDALSRNTAAVILVHNHPSGVADPSRADELLTSTLKSALALVDVKVLDHMIVTGSTVLSFAERGLI